MGFQICKDKLSAMRNCVSSLREKEHEAIDDQRCVACPLNLERLFVSFWPFKRKSHAARAKKFNNPDKNISSAIMP